ncbi:MAG: hypothetical protein M3O15_04850 [Acidobacteriota bacterium]|nr:hypothetical protein [Acidobacteriota bacterium]
MNLKLAKPDGNFTVTATFPDAATVTAEIAARHGTIHHMVASARTSRHR